MGRRKAVDAQNDSAYEFSRISAQARSLRGTEN